MKKILLIGCGLVGKTIAFDLSKKYDLTVSDIDKRALLELSKNLKVKTELIDVNNLNDLIKKVNKFKTIVTAVPGFCGFKLVKNLINLKKNIIDISFSPENYLELDKYAKKNKVTVLVDFGLAPGIDNLILGHYNKIIKINKFECYVGGLPKIKKPPFYYKAPFSPIDVVEEYTRPARIMRNGEVITKKALTEPEIIKFPKIGELEAFNTDGLRSILFTMKHIPNMIEKTLRYKGHLDVINTLKKIGFLNNKSIKFKNVKTSNLEMSAKMLVEKWKMNPKEKEITVMRVIIEGVKNKKNIKYIFDLYDEFDEENMHSSMSRTTGFTCSAGVDLITKKYFKEHGVFPPEEVGENDKSYEYVMNYLKDKNININKKQFN